MKRPLLLVSAVVLLTVGCEKAKSSGTPSGAASGDEVALMKHLPKGNNALFGGRFEKFQEFMKGSLFTELVGLAGQDAPGFKPWTDCFMGYKVVMLGGMAISEGRLTMSYVMKGVTAQQIAECGKKANFATTVDPDGKWVVVDTPAAGGTTQQTGYLALADGTVFTSIEMEMPATVAEPDRAKAEAVQASLASGTAADDTHLAVAMENVDRKRAMWFVGSAAGTPLADKITSVAGWMDMGSGLSFDVTVEVATAALADEVAKGMPQLKESADMLGPEVASVIKGLKFDRSGKKLHFALSVSEAQLKALMETLKPMMGR